MFTSIGRQFWCSNKSILLCIICDFIELVHSIGPLACMSEENIDEHAMWIVTLNFGQITLKTKACLFILHGENGMFTITSECSLIKMTNWLDFTLSAAVITWIVSLALTQPLQCNYANSSTMQKIGLMCLWYFWIRIPHEIDFEAFSLSYRTLYNSIVSSCCSLGSVFISLKVIIYSFDKTLCI